MMCFFFYLHNFVTDIDAKGVGKIFLQRPKSMQAPKERYILD